MARRAMGMIGGLAVLLAVVLCTPAAWAGGLTGSSASPPASRTRAMPTTPSAPPTSVDLGSADINITRSSGTVPGDYRTNSLNVFNFNIVRRF